MKHWFAVPYGDDLDESGRLHGWLYDRGWGVTRWEYEYRYGDPCRIPGRSRLTIAISPAWAPSVVQMTVVSGVTLVYDDVERTMGVTDKPEPQDAMPVEPEDAVPSFVEQHADTGLLESGKERRRSGILKR